MGFLFVGEFRNTYFGKEESDCLENEGNNFDEFK
jgi:hypothetical protein